MVAKYANTVTIRDNTVALRAKCANTVDKFGSTVRISANMVGKFGHMVKINPNMVIRSLNMAIRSQ